MAENIVKPKTQEEKDKEELGIKPGSIEDLQWRFHLSLRFFQELQDSDTVVKDIAAILGPGEIGYRIKPL